MLTDEQKAFRKIGGSDANILMSGDQERIYNLWLEKTGQKEPEDLSDVLPVQIGIVTEELNLNWFEKKTGLKVGRRGESIAHPEYPFMTATLDGATDDAIVEAKHVNAFGSLDDVIERYMPQLHHNGYVCSSNKAYLSVIQGTQKYEYFAVDLDDWYTIELIEAEKKFWQCVQDKTPPNDFKSIDTPTFSTMRVVDMTGNNEFASLAADYVENENAAKMFEKAKKGIKGLIEPDVSLAHGYGVEVKRAKNGSLTIRREKQ